MEFQEIKLGENFWCFEQNYVRSFLFIGEPFSLLVDSCYGGDLLRLCQSKTKTSIRLLLTHTDRDHIGCMNQFTEIYMHPAELYNFQNDHAHITPVWDGETIDIGTFQFQIIHLPGHTPGSIALLESSKRFLLAGDSIQTGPIYMFGEKRNVGAYRMSMERLSHIQTDFDQCFCSHHELTVAPGIIEDLYSLAADIEQGQYPEAQPLPEATPSSVPRDKRIYQKGKAKFYL